MKPRLREIASGRRDVFNLNPVKIRIEKDWNPRRYSLFENRQHLDDLKLSIAQVGVLVPLLVRWDGEQAILIDGECRLRACLELIKEGTPIKSVPVLQETANDDASRLVLALSANTGKPLTLLESGNAYNRLLRFGWGLEEIAQKTGTTRAKVALAVEMANAPQDIKEMVSKGEVTPSLAKQVVRQKGDQAAAELVKKVSQAKAAGKKTATREAKPGKMAQARRAEKTQVEQEREIGDAMAASILEASAPDQPIWRLARKWNKLRGL